MADQNNKLYNLLVNSAARLPEQIAVEDPERENEISYADFDACTDQIKEKLVAARCSAGRSGRCLCTQVDLFFVGCVWCTQS